MIRKRRIPPSPWALWGMWATASFAGYSIAFFLLSLDIGPTPYSYFGRGYLRHKAVFGIVIVSLCWGGLVGVSQWLVLRVVADGAAWWIPAGAVGNFIGFLAYHSVYNLLAQINRPLLLDCAILLGPTVLLQWLLLRGAVRHSYLWILGSFALVNTAGLLFPFPVYGDVDYWHALVVAVGTGILIGVWFGYGEHMLASPPARGANADP